MDLLQRLKENKLKHKHFLVELRKRIKCLLQKLRTMIFFT